VIRGRATPPVAVTLQNARMGGGDIGSLRIEGSRIAAINEPPRRGDLVMDLKGDRLLPGLINAHDHLQLNGLPRLESAGHYVHVRDWISDINRRRRSDPGFEARIAIERDERLAVGGLKNLLSGVTTVAHHDPLYPSLAGPNFPTRVMQDFGWAHSLYIDGEDAVRRSYLATPRDWPWIIHGAEGVNEEAAQEFDRLETLGCVASNTLIVHGIALDQERRMRLDGAQAGLIWCPSSNLRLFGKTAQIAGLLQRGRIALGTDSRLSGERDLLDELRIARGISGLDERTLEGLATRDNARLLRLSDRGLLKVGYRADLLIVPEGAGLSRLARADIRLVLLDGLVRYGDRDYAETIAPAADWSAVRVDGKDKILGSGIAALLRNASSTEEGVELAGSAWRAA